MTENSKCPFAGDYSTNSAAKAARNMFPETLNLDMLRQHSLKANPFDQKFDYALEFNSLDLKEVAQDINRALVDSKEWWPADWGHYGPLMIRLAWHSAGTYRVKDGRGGASNGNQRFAPLNSWPDNGNLDKARRLLWPIKKKYGKKLSWGDLFIFAGNCALESMGFETCGFAGGREDIWESEKDVFWGEEEAFLTNNRRYDEKGTLKNPLGASEMGLIYVNPAGPGGEPDVLGAARDIRLTFRRMAMNDEETVALIAGGHTFGKAHGAAPDSYVGKCPEEASLEAQGLGWINTFKTGSGPDTITSGFEGAWTSSPIKWDGEYFDNLFQYEWVTTMSPSGNVQWIPREGGEEKVVDAHDPSIKHAPMMFTTDIALITDPAYKAISKRFHENHEEFQRAFALAWFKLTHRDMGPKSRYLGNLVPKDDFLWQDPIPIGTNVNVKLSKESVKIAKLEIWNSGLSVSELVSIAWASASTFRNSDKRGGANGARILLEPQKNWKVNTPDKLARVSQTLKSIQQSINKQLQGTQQQNQNISMADLIVLAGYVGIERAAESAGIAIEYTCSFGRNDAIQEQTDVASFGHLEPEADGFRNFASRATADSKPEELLVDRAQLLTLSPPEMTALVGGLRVLDPNYGQSQYGVFTKTPGRLTNDYFVNLLDYNVGWAAVDEEKTTFEGVSRITGQRLWKATRVDLIFGSHPELRAISEVYACDDGKMKFVDDFLKAWTKVMNLDRFDL